MTDTARAGVLASALALGSPANILLRPPHASGGLPAHPVGYAAK